MDDAFQEPCGWLYATIFEDQIWNRQPAPFEDIVGLTDGPEISDFSLYLAPQSLSLTFPEHMSLTSPGQTSLDIFDVSEETNGALVPPHPFQIGYSSISSHSSDSHISMNSYASHGVPYYGLQMVNSPDPVQPERLFHGDDGPCREGTLPAGPPGPSLDTTSDCEQTAEMEPWQPTEPGVRRKKPTKRAPGRSHTVSSRVGASEDKVSTECPSCRRKLSCQSSLLRHQKEKCGSESERGRHFHCDSRFHPGCKRTFKRRCGLKGHYKKLHLTEKQAVAKVWEQYPKGMHRRRD